MNRRLIFQYFVCVFDVFLAAFTRLKTKLHSVSYSKIIRGLGYGDYLSVSI